MNVSRNHQPQPLAESSWHRKRNEAAAPFEDRLALIRVVSAHGQRASFALIIDRLVVAVFASSPRGRSLRVADGLDDPVHQRFADRVAAEHADGDPLFPHLPAEAAP